MDDKPIPVPGDVWRHGADERRGVIRDIEVDGSYKPGFLHATGVQSGRETRIRLVNGRLPSPWYRLTPLPRRATMSDLTSYSRTVTSQAELDQAVADGVGEIEIRSPRGVWIEVSGSASVDASDSASVRAYDSASVRASGSASVHAYGSASVHAYGSASVHAYGSASVDASDSASVRAYDSASVHAGSHVAVHLHSGRATVEGGVLIDHAAVDESDPATWASYHGAATSGCTVTLFKAVRDDMRSAHGTLYEIGAEVSCDDFEDTDACGNGLHFSPTPGHAAEYDSEATRFLECTVLLSELRPITGSGMTAKCKSPRAQVLREVDVHGRPVQAAVSAGGLR